MTEIIRLIIHWIGEYIIKIDGKTPINIHNNDPITIAIIMFKGASLGLWPDSWAKKAKNGILIPEWCNTPADANKSIK